MDVPALQRTAMFDAARLIRACRGVELGHPGAADEVEAVCAAWADDAAPLLCGLAVLAGAGIIATLGGNVDDITFHIAVGRAANLIIGHYPKAAP